MVSSARQSTRQRDEHKTLDQLKAEFSEVIGLSKRKDFSSAFLGNWLIETANRLVSTQKLQQDDDKDDLVQQSAIRMWKALQNLDYSKTNAQLWLYVKAAGNWGIKDELKKRWRFLKKKEFYMSKKHEIDW